ncbi:Sulfate transporter 3.1 [Bienertia sinuspersici]
MGTINKDDQYVHPSMNDEKCKSRVAVPPPEPFFKSLQTSLKETFFADDPLRQFKSQPKSKKFILGLQYVFPFFEWAPSYRWDLLKSDLVAGITTASLAIPQGISYAKLAHLPPILGLCKYRSTDNITMIVIAMIMFLYLWLSF